MKLFCCNFKHLSFSPEAQSFLWFVGSFIHWLAHWLIHSLSVYLLSTYLVPRCWGYKEKGLGPGGA